MKHAPPQLIPTKPNPQHSARSFQRGPSPDVSSVAGTPTRDAVPCQATQTPPGTIACTFPTTSANAVPTTTNKQEFTQLQILRAAHGHSGSGGNERPRATQRRARADEGSIIQASNRRAADDAAVYAKEIHHRQATTIMACIPNAPPHSTLLRCCDQHADAHAAFELLTSSSYSPSCPCQTQPRQKKKANESMSRPQTFVPYPTDATTHLPHVPT